MSDTVDAPPDVSRFQPVLPRAVREAAARADQLVRDIGADPDNPPAPTTVVEDGAPTQTPDPVVLPPFQAAPAPAPEATPAPGSEATWEQRYNSLQGRYNQEIAALRGQVTTAQREAGQLRDLLATVSRQPPPAPSAPAAPATTTVAIPQEDVEEFGDPLIAAARRWARAEVAPEIQRLEQQVQLLTGTANETTEQVRKRNVEAVLDREIPDWNTINDSQGWAAWLQESDPFSGHKRYDMVNDAYVRGDARRTMAFFRAFIAEQTAVDPITGIHRGHTGMPAAAIPLEDLAQPGRGPMGSQAAGGAPARRTWTRAQITAFFDRATRGQYRGREAEKARIEADLMSAQAEGRIVD